MRPTPVVINFRTAPIDQVKAGAYVGRPSRWGNPFVIGVHGTREEVIVAYGRYIRGKLDDDPSALRAFEKLAESKYLTCYCAPLPCHADVLVEIMRERGLVE